MKLPEDKQLDRLIGSLGHVQDLLDRVHAAVDRISVARLAKDADEAQIAEAHGPELLIALDGLAFNGQEIELWASKLWCVIKDEKKWHREVD